METKNETKKEMEFRKTEATLLESCGQLSVSVHGRDPF